MNPRSVAVILGLAVGIASFLALKFDWAETAAFVHAGAIAALLAGPVAHLAWAVSGGTVAFAAAALLISLLTGAAEISRTRRQIDSLRLDPALADRWNAADWRAAFARTAVADQAEAMIAPMPADREETRRAVVDTPLLLGLNGIWLDRLTLTRTIAPLPPILASLSATLALMAYEAGERWAAILAAGTAGWFAIRVLRYLARATLAPLVDRAVASATAAIRPLSVAHALAVHRPPATITTSPGSVTPTRRIEPEDAEIIAAALSKAIREPLGLMAETAAKRIEQKDAEIIAAALSNAISEPLGQIAEAAGKRIERQEAEIIAAALSNAMSEPLGRMAEAAAKRIEQEEAEIIAAALSNAIWEPLGRMADAAEKLAAPVPPSRDHAIEAAMAEVRAGIEKLLSASSPA